MSELNIGSIAPNFDLQDYTGKTIRLADFKGKQAVVLIFYPMDQTPGCTKQLCTARDDSAEYDQAGVAVFGVNGGSGESHQKFVEKHNLTTPLLIDTNFETARRYNALRSLGPIKLINRTVVGIDQEGKIAFYKRGMPSTREILAALSPTSVKSPAALPLS